MFKSPALRQAIRSTARVTQGSPRASPISNKICYNARTLTTSRSLLRPTEEELEKATTAAPAGASGDHEGSLARTDGSVSFLNPEEKDQPSSKPVRGRGGEHALPTLATFSLQGKTCVITGGARGLGLVMAQAMVISGADVAIVDMNIEEAKKSAGTILKVWQDENPGADRKPLVTAHYADVSSPDSVSESFSAIVKEHGKVDGLVTSAGFCENVDAVNYPYDRMKKLWGVNVDGTYLFCVETAKHLMGRKAAGSIVCIGSMSGSIVNVPQPQAPYNASKAAVRHLVSSFAVEWAQHNIRVNNISPGYMFTALTKQIIDNNPDLYRQWTSLVPQGKMGRPEDLMGAVVFLLSDASGYVTGADLAVDGGYTRT